jgi:hypothetical protein
MKKEYPQEFLDAIEVARQEQIKADILMLKKVYQDTMSDERINKLAEQGNPKYTEVEIEMFYKKMYPIIFNK